jgi:hypothetical protein
MADQASRRDPTVDHVLTTDMSRRSWRPGHDRRDLGRGREVNVVGAGEDLRLPPQAVGFVHFLAAIADQGRDLDLVRARRAAACPEDLQLPSQTV